MADIRGLTRLVGLNLTDKTSDSGYRYVRTTPDGGLFVVDWFQSLVFHGIVFYANAGSVSTGIAGHAAADADQPEIAVRVPDGTEAIPLWLKAETESFETTLGIHGLMFAASNIDVGNGTSTAFTGDDGSATGKGINMRIDKPLGSNCIVRHTYSGNGTDPLTAGNFLELGRESGNFDADAATSGIKGLSLLTSYRNMPMPVIKDAGSILGYGEGGTTANYYFKVIWAENTEGWLSS